MDEEFEKCSRRRSFGLAANAGTGGYVGFVRVAQWRAE